MGWRGGGEVGWGGVGMGEVAAPLATKHCTERRPHAPCPCTAPQSGLDLLAGCVRNNVEAGVLEPTISKLKILQFATEAAITILRIDDLIRLEPEQEEGGEEY